MLSSALICIADLRKVSYDTYQTESRHDYDRPPAGYGHGPMETDEDMGYRQMPPAGYPPVAAYPPGQNNYSMDRDMREPPRAPVTYDRHGQPIATPYPPEQQNYYAVPMNPGQGMPARGPLPAYAVPRAEVNRQGGRTPPQARAPQPGYGQGYSQGDVASGIPVSAAYYESAPPRRVDRHHPRR